MIQITGFRDFPTTRMMIVGLALKGKKRQSRSTGGTFQPSNVTETQFKVTTEQFKTLDTDEKLVTLSELLTSAGNVHGRLSNVENQVNKVQKRSPDMLA